MKTVLMITCLLWATVAIARFIGELLSKRDGGGGERALTIAMLFYIMAQFF